MNDTKKKMKEYTKKTRLQSVDFTDGMIVTAGDLETAVGYPVQLFKTLVRAYFGCGIVCGLKLEVCGKWGVKIHGGVALDCEGHPLEVCESWKIDLAPEGCAGPEPDKTYCLAISRGSEHHVPDKDCDCCGKGKGKVECRHHEHLVLRVFDSECPPDNLCWVKDAQPVDDNTPPVDPIEACECVKTCPGSCGCGDCWVFLGCVALGKDRIVAISKTERRRYVKPIHCRCQPDDFNRGFEDGPDEMTSAEG